MSDIFEILHCCYFYFNIMIIYLKQERSISVGYILLSNQDRKCYLCLYFIRFYRKELSHKPGEEKRRSKKDMSPDGDEYDRKHGSDKRCDIFLFFWHFKFQIHVFVYFVFTLEEFSKTFPI